MKISFFTVVLMALFSFSAQAQKHLSDSSLLLQLNQQIDDAVVKQDTAQLSMLYANDFVFSHGSGNVDNRASWLRSVSRGGFTLRQHDSVKVELHEITAILRGKLTVQKKTPKKTDNYFLKYVRVYAFRNEHWQMISHFTFYEKHLSE